MGVGGNDIIAAQGRDDLLFTPRLHASGARVTLCFNSGNAALPAASNGSQGRAMMALFGPEFGTKKGKTRENKTTKKTLLCTTRVSNCIFVTRRYYLWPSDQLPGRRAQRPIPCCESTRADGCGLGSGHVAREPRPQRCTASTFSALCLLSLCLSTRVQHQEPGSRPPSIAASTAAPRFPFAFCSCIKREVSCFPTRSAVCSVQYYRKTPCQRRELLTPATRSRAAPSCGLDSALVSRHPQHVSKCPGLPSLRTGPGLVEGEQRMSSDPGLI